MPVMGSILLFVTVFMLVSGLQMIVGSGMDAKKTLVIGVSLAFGLSIDVIPVLWAGLPSRLQPLFGSSLTLATVMAVVLNQLLSRAGRPAAGA